MKNYKLLITVFFISFLSNAQNANDTKDFISEKIKANNPIPSYVNYVFFQNIMKVDADRLAGKKLSDTEFENVFIYMRECHINDSPSSGVWLNVAETIDIRGIEKVSITKNTNGATYYIIALYLNGNYYSKKYSHTPNKEPSYEYLPKMEILIGNNLDAANSIKAAIIHLGKLKGITIKDGDLF